MSVAKNLAKGLSSSQHTAANELKLCSSIPIGCFIPCFLLLLTHLNFKEISKWIGGSGLSFDQPSYLGGFLSSLHCFVLVKWCRGQNEPAVWQECHLQTEISAVAQGFLRLSRLSFTEDAMGRLRG